MKRLISVFALLLFISSASFGQSDEYSKTLKKMFELSGTENTYKSAIKQMFDMFKQQYPDVSEEVWSDFEKEFQKTSLNDLVKLLVPVYKKYMTQEDLEGMIAFYQTPVGQKYAKSTPLIMQESMQVGQQWGREIGQRFEKKMKEKLDSK